MLNLFAAATSLPAPLPTIKTLLGFFSATFIRLTPSAYRIISSLQRIKFTQKMLNSLHKNLTYFDKINLENFSLLVN